MELLNAYVDGLAPRRHEVMHNSFGWNTDGNTIYKW